MTGLKAVLESLVEGAWTREALARLPNGDRAFDYRSGAVRARCLAGWMYYHGATEQERQALRRVVVRRVPSTRAYDSLLAVQMANDAQGTTLEDVRSWVEEAIRELE